MDIFLDSGAFSAHTRGVEIPIQEYIDFIKEHIDVINVYSNLDVIRNPKQTWQNQIIMEKAGLKPVPVYHFGEEIKWLKRYLNTGKYDYISIDGMVGSRTEYLKRWLDNVFANYLTDEEGYPILKVHGFGLSRVEMITRYPWYSVDTSAPVMRSAMGRIYVAHEGYGSFKGIDLRVTDKPPFGKDHINGLSPLKKEKVLEYIDSLGYSMGNEENPGIGNDRYMRHSINVDYMKGLEEHLSKKKRPFKIKSNTLLGDI